ncbi:uncharacterized protein LOC143078561 [Mytilus galloprovincialis]|uniref:uncharacterized protein LOC143078561 n=1 Tax=Mytilus galloprovincialis TaxID=29158 RepID=UPI003F7BD928
MSTLTYIVKYYLFIISGGKSQSVESGSSCWPICRVGQDPNTSSSGPERVRRSPKKERADKKPTDFPRSSENERADKKKERKLIEVVRPQPTRPLPPMHLKTDNTGRAEYSTETEIFKPPALPSINKASDSPRPLPQKPPVTQLDPLRESTSERKKKKKRKKKEPKQSDEEN